MTLFARPPDVLEREPSTVMVAVCADEVQEIQKLWSWFENLVGLRGRKMYAMVDVNAHTYTTCTPVRCVEEPTAFGLDVADLPGGRFRRGRLHGNPPDVYACIGPGFEELEAAGSVDRDRPLVEFYKRQDHIELWVPVATTSAGCS